MSKRRLNPTTTPRTPNRRDPFVPPTQPLDGPQPHLPPSKPFAPAVTPPTTILHSPEPAVTTTPIAKPSDAPKFNDPPNEKHQL